MVAKVEVVNYSCEVCAAKYTTLALAESCEQKCTTLAATSEKVAGALDTFRLQATSLCEVFEFVEAAIRAKSSSPKAMKITFFSPMLLRKYPIARQFKERLLEPLPSNKRHLDVICFYMSVAGTIRVKQGDSWANTGRVSGKDLEIPGMYVQDVYSSASNCTFLLPLVEWPGIAKAIEEAKGQEESLLSETVSLKKQLQQELMNDSVMITLQKESQEIDVVLKELEGKMATLTKKKTGIGSQLRKRRKALCEQSDLQKKIFELESETLPSLKEHHQSVLGLEVR